LLIYLKYLNFFLPVCYNFENPSVTITIQKSEDISMGLYKKQLALQRETIDEFESKIKKQIEKKLKYGRQNIDDTFERRYLKRFADKITQLRDKKLPKVIGRIFLDEKYRDEITTLYGEGELLDSNLKRKAKDIAPKIQESINIKKKIKDPIQKKIYKILKEKNEKLDISIEELQLKQKEYRFTLGTIMLSSGEIAWLTLKSLGGLLEKDFSDDEDRSTTQQAIINNIAEELLEHIAFRFKREGISIEEWENTTEIDIGESPFSILMELDIVEEFDKGDTSIHLKFTSDFLKNSKSIYDSMLRYIPPSYEPMIVPPTHWSTIDDGGFIKDKDSSPKYDIYIMKTTTKRDKTNLLKKADNFSPKLLKAINAIQDTKWQINRDLLGDFGEYIKHTKESNRETLKKLRRDIKAKSTEYKDQKKVIKIKRETLEELGIDKPTIKEKLSKESDELYTTKRSLQKIKKQRDKIEGEINIKEKILARAKKYSKYDDIYFVWQIDFRGRVYPIQPLLNPQGEDFAKALLRFSTQKPLGDRGEYWFKIHGANLYGEDKVSFDDRVKWVDEHTQDILDIFDYEDRFENEFLKKADKPFGFLAFAYEYREFISNPKEFKSSLPIAMDGSNNGFQHITALLRDVNGAKKVNVLPSKEQKAPNDIYKDIAQKTKELISSTREHEIGEDIDTIYDYITRDMTKKNVMTEVYGAGKDAKIGQIEEYIKSKLQEDLGWSDSQVEVISKYLQKKIEEVMKNELPSSNIYKKWMKSISKKISQQNRAIEWTTPIIGFEITQEEFILKEDKIATKYNNKKRQIQIKIPTNDISDIEQSKGIAPNFIHSLDATHLFLTILKAKESGIDSFATIHDSFGTHACDIDKLQKSIKDSFIEIYSLDILEDLRQSIKESYDIDIKPIKYQGDLESFELEKIRESLYFFS